MQPWACTVKAGLVKAKETLSKAQEAAQTAAREAQEALQQLEELRSEKHRLTGETGVEAEKRRAQLKEALQKELAQLKSEVESSEAECQKINRRMDWHRQLKEQQQFARCAAKEAAATLRGVYGDLSRGKSAKPSDTATGQKARRLSKHLDDFLRFLAEAVALAEDKNAVPKTDSALKEAYVAKLGQSEDNSGPVQQLDATKEKLKVVRSELQEAQEGHESEAERLQEDCEDLRQRILEGQEQLQEEKRKSEEAKQRLCEGITEAVRGASVWAPGHVHVTWDLQTTGRRPREPLRSPTWRGEAAAAAQQASHSNVYHGDLKFARFYAAQSARFLGRIVATHQDVALLPKTKQRLCPIPRLRACAVLPASFVRGRRRAHGWLHGGFGAGANASRERGTPCWT
eukprot:g20345.t1